jgi:carboxyl-terminal processing protease
MKALLKAIAVFIFAGIHLTFAQQVECKTNDPGTNFKYLWSFFDKHYALFGVKNINWDSALEKYGPQISANTNDTDLFNVMAEMLSELNDHHVNLTSPFNQFNSGTQKNKNDARFKVVGQYYLKGNFSEKVFVPDPDGSTRSLFKTGMFENNIAYININGFRSEEESISLIDSFVNSIQNADALIIDIRNNGGGADDLIRPIAGRFDKDKKTFLRIKFRYGDKHNDFTSPETPWSVEPEGNLQFTKPIVLLTNRNTASAAENFELAMKTMDNVTVIGDTTAGVYSTSLHCVLPNGWDFTCSNAVYTDQNHICYEGTGIAPDLFATNTTEDLSEGKDNVLEKAIQFLRGDFKINKIRIPDTAIVKQSIASYVTKEIQLKNKSIDTILNDCSRLMVHDSGNYYYDDYEMLQVVISLAEDNRMKEIKPVFDFMSSHTGNSLFKNYFQCIDFVESNQSYRADTIVNTMIRNNRVEEILYDEDIVNNTAYVFNSIGYPDVAFYLFKLNARLHPDSPNVYDSLGEAYRKAGNNAEAKVNYEILLKLDPSNENARQALEKIN